MLKKSKLVSRFSASLIAGSALLASHAVVAQVAAEPVEAKPKEMATAEIGEIVVTATRRAALLREVPIAVSAVNEAEIESKRLSNFSDIVNITPGPTFIPVKGAATTAVQIRGRFSQNDATALENPVAVYIDDIYYGSLASFDSDFLDSSQIAVLRGPQGTTFGRNAVGGALQITSNVAQVGEKSGQISFTGLKFTGGKSGVESQGYVNFPINDQVAGRVAYSIKDNGGYMHNLVTGHYLSDNKIMSIKGSVVYEPTPDLKVTALASASRRDNLGDGFRIYGMGAIAAKEAAASSNFHDVMVDDEGKVKRDIFSGQLRVDKNTAHGMFTSITGYRSLDATDLGDGDGGPLPLNFPSGNFNKEHQFSQEFRLTSPSGGDVEYLLGVYYSYEDLNHSIQFNFDGTVPGSRLATFTGGKLQTQLVSGVAKVTNLGPYVESKWNINKQWAITGGLRYVYERKEGNTTHIGTSAFYGGPYSQDLGPTTWTAWTPRVILEYKPAKDHLLYASASNGFQGGGWVLTAPTAAKAADPLAPEKTWSYEVGTKSSWFDRLLTTNIALYSAETKNLQVRSLVDGVLTDSNAGVAKVNGLEVETALRPVRSLALGINYAYTDAKYKSFKGCAAGGVDCTGKQIHFTPKNDTTLFVDYKLNLQNGSLLTFHADDKFASPYQLVSTNAQQIAVPLTERKNIISASVAYEPSRKDWSLRFWGKNLANKTIVTNGLNYYFYNMSIPEAVAAGAAADSERLAIGPPRQIGVTFTYKFD